MSQLQSFRPGTKDESIFRLASSGLEYRMPERFQADDIVIDIGMHIGGFCVAALERGSSCVHGFEAEAENFARAAENLRPFGDRVRLYHRAVWRSDKRAAKLKFTGSNDQTNTGGGGLIFWEGLGGVEEEVEAVAFDDVVNELTEHGRKRIRFLKIDCEGSEFPILLTSRRLHLIDQIAGEFHELGGDFENHEIPERARIDGLARFTIVELRRALEKSGFVVETERHGASHLGLFFASRPPRLSPLRRLVQSLNQRRPR